MTRVRKNIGMLLGLLLLATAFLAGCGGQGTTSETSSSGSSAAAVTKSAPAPTMPSGQVMIRMLDVGQGDSILVQTAEQTVLIDTSDVDEQDKLRTQLQKAGVTKIDKVILTHPHADHIGGMPVLYADYQVGEIYDNGVTAKSKIYRNYVKQAKAKHIPLKTLKAGDELDFGGGVKFHVYAPGAKMLAESKDEHFNQNNGSIVGQLVCGNFKMLFTGDAEQEAEQEIDASYKDVLNSDVLKAGHHGSKTSSSPTFLRYVHPQVCLISCGPKEEKGGTGNTYGHPHEQTLKKYKALKAQVFVTAWQGTITITTDGQTYKVAAEHAKDNLSAPGETYEGQAGTR